MHREQQRIWIGALLVVSLLFASPATRVVAQHTPIPAEYQEVKKTKKVAEGQMEWRSILCQTNTTPGLITTMQKALKDAGYNPGPIDGSIGFQTLAAIESFQRAKGLARGGLTMEALKELGVHLNKVDVAAAAVAVP